MSCSVSISLGLFIRLIVQRSTDTGTCFYLSAIHFYFNSFVFISFVFFFLVDQDWKPPLFRADRKPGSGHALQELTTPSSEQRAQMQRTLLQGILSQPPQMAGIVHPHLHQGMLHPAAIRNNAYTTGVKTG